MTGRYPRTTNFNFLYGDFTALKMDEYVQRLPANGKINFNPNEVISEQCGTSRSELC
jgi:hypothetical protein